MILSKYSSQRAFTLIETVVVIAFSVSVMIALGVLIFNFTKTSAYDQALAQSSGSATALMREIELLTFPADAVLQTHTFPGGIIYTSSTTTLVLEIPSIDNSGNVIATMHDYAAFYLVGTNAYRLLDKSNSSSRTAGTKQFSSTISSLSFSYNNADFTKVSTTTVDIRTQVWVKQQILSDHRNEQLRLRNH